MGCSRAVLRGKFIEIQSYFKKQETSHKQPNLTPKAIRERRTKKKTQSEQKERNHKDKIRDK